MFHCSLLRNNSPGLRKFEKLRQGHKESGKNNIWGKIGHFNKFITSHSAWMFLVKSSLECFINLFEISNNINNPDEVAKVQAACVP